MLAFAVAEGDLFFYRSDVPTFPTVIGAARRQPDRATFALKVVQKSLSPGGNGLCPTARTELPALEDLQ